MKLDEMKHFFKRLFGRFSSLHANSDSTRQNDSPLKNAFRRAREQRNIDLILPVFQQSQLFVVAGSDGQSGDLNDLFLVPSPGGNSRMCITVSERKEWLSKVQWPMRSTTGEQLLSRLASELEITVVYADGGDFITREHRDWYRMLPSANKTS